MGHFDPFPPPRLNGRVSVQLADLRRSEREREGCAESGRSWDLIAAVESRLLESCAHNFRPGAACSVQVFSCARLAKRKIDPCERDWYPNVQGRERAICRRNG